MVYLRLYKEGDKVGKLGQGSEECERGYICGVSKTMWVYEEMIIR